MVEPSPVPATFLRTLHDTWNFNRTTPKLTPYCFKLMGNSAMQNGAFEPDKTAILKYCFINDQTEVFVDS
jgi:hypothetical protein